jgi:hypothetical protein
MSRSVKFGKSDAVVRNILDVLGKYEEEHAKAKIDVYRQNDVAVRIRIIDPDFSGKDLGERDAMVWTFLDELPDEAISEITLLLLFTPKETKKSFANMEFENPVPTMP